MTHNKSKSFQSIEKEYFFFKIEKILSNNEWKDEKLARAQPKNYTKNY